MPISQRHLVAGLITLSAIILVVGLVVALYAQVFTPTVALTVASDRAGLLTDVGSPVRLHGARIGKVASITDTGSGVQLHLKIDPDALEQIGPDSVAHIDASTVFGGKSVVLDNPVNGLPGHIKAGTVIAGARVTTEVNTLFENASSMITAVQPNELNAGLGAVATALRGQGAQLGGLFGDLDAYVPRINPVLPTVHHDFDEAARVADVYDRATPDLLRMLGNFGRTSATLVNERGRLHEFILDLGRMSLDTKGFLDDVGPNLDDVTANTAPVLDLLAEYSPEITCVVHGIDYNRRLVDPVAGGNQPGLRLLFTLQPSVDPYRYPRDLPVHNATTGPNCYDLPYIPSSKIPTPVYPFADGTHTREQPSPPLRAGQLTDALFGRDGGALTRLLYPDNGVTRGQR